LEPEEDMAGTQVKAVRKRLELTQAQAARRWRVSQAYLSLMEHGRRRVPDRLARLLARSELNLATALPLECPVRKAEDLPKLLGALGYSGFAYLGDPRAVANPAAVVLAALKARDVPARVTEALPWVLVTFADLDWRWLVNEAKLANLQNRLGYLVELATQVALAKGGSMTGKLEDAQAHLEDARLAKEDTLGRELTGAEREHLRQHRPDAAAHWNLLTTLRAEDLRYGS
jgi:transcriptional regulator with XRE-family HTH domain